MSSQLGTWCGLPSCLADSCLLVVFFYDSFSGCALTLLIKPGILSDGGPTLMTSFNLDYLLKVPPLQIERKWGLGLNI